MDTHRRWSLREFVLYFSDDSGGEFAQRSHYTAVLLNWEIFATFVSIAFCLHAFGNFISQISVNRFIWLEVKLITLFIKHNQNNYLKTSVSTSVRGLVRRSWYSVLPILDTTGRCRVKKAVVCVAQLVAALITVHGLFFLSDVYGLLDPSGKTLWLCRSPSLGTS